MTAAKHYAARVDAVLAQRARLRGTEPSGDLFGDLEPGHQLLKTDPRRELDANLKALADLIEPSDTIVDVGGGAGRMSLPLALRCHSVTNVDPSASMGAAFLANAKAAGISNVSLVQGDWLTADMPQGTVALVNHVTYLTRDIVPFMEKLEPDRAVRNSPRPSTLLPRTSRCRPNPPLATTAGAPIHGALRHRPRVSFGAALVARLRQEIKREDD